MNHQNSTIASSVSDRLRILKYWYQIEFFIPFDLQRQVLEGRDAETSVRTFSVPQLRRADTAALWSGGFPANRKLTGFEIYLGVFDRRELTAVTRQVLQDTPSPVQELEQQERGDLEGVTCFARLKADALGKTSFDEVSVSTVPWALGCIQKFGLDGLDFDTFQFGLKTLAETLHNFRAARTPAATGDDAGPETQGETAIVSMPLTASELLALLDILSDWAAYRPQTGRSDAPVLVIRALTIEHKKTACESQAAGGRPSGTLVEQDDEEPVKEDGGIDILNSFYAQDIARAISSLRNGQDCPALLGYLTPLADGGRIDLYRPEGRETIARVLRPELLNTGHWLDRPRHAMSLMQQFAINSVFEQLKTPGIFSVNGPPGTGKTTLLRDIFADNIVQRARVLASLDKAGDAFLPDAVRVAFSGSGNSCTIAQLRQELTGFEMVVASSNNAAVENISRDLPKTKSLGKPSLPGEKGWRDGQGKAQLHYLQQVAHNLAARNGKGEYDTLSAADEPWGLIACALGKKSNRSAFVERLSFAGARPLETPPKGYDPAKHQSIWNWRDGYRGPGFAEARQAFLAADAEVRMLLEQMTAYVRFQQAFSGHTPASFTRPAEQGLLAAQRADELARADLMAIEEERALFRSQLDLLGARERLIRKRRPGWWARLVKSAAYTDYAGSLEANLRGQETSLRRLAESEETVLLRTRSVQHTKAELDQAAIQLRQKQADWKTGQEKLGQFAAMFPHAACPKDLSELEQDRWQIDGIWRHETLNEKRSALFAAALQLQQAWLAEVLKKGGRFGSNLVALCQLLSGKRPQQMAHALAIWQSLFMVVPVVSTTFASFASQFRDLGPGSLGWLLIDEAGQAVPQAAVGALWRSQRAVVVGDPRQIEPVFTVPPALIEALARWSGVPPETNVAPHRSSVQNLADAANPLGTWTSGVERQWIGSPLRVHRRCVDPMFSLANEIAYEGKMVFFDPVDPARRRPPADSFDIGPSAWVDVTGAVRGRQTVPAQIDLVHRALAAIVESTGSLPPLYIITPFKRIREDLVSRLEDLENWKELMRDSAIAMPKKTALREWCRARVGTVHTFQGKEESMVWMVLGCDEQTRAAASWAAAKPNLLNVALTRAQHRFFLIGDAALWGGLPHFQAMHEEILPRISDAVFLQRVRQQVLALVE